MLLHLVVVRGHLVERILDHDAAGAFGSRMRRQVLDFEHAAGAAHIDLHESNRLAGHAVFEHGPFRVHELGDDQPGYGIRPTAMRVHAVGDGGSSRHRAIVCEIGLEGLDPGRDLGPRDENYGRVIDPIIDGHRVLRHLIPSLHRA